MLVVIEDESDIPPPLATTLAVDVLSHQLWGPRRKSWGIEMTVLAAIMRDVSLHTHLADLVRHHYVPPRII